MKFFVKYIAVAIIASVATYYGAPYLKPYLPTAYAGQSEAIFVDAEEEPAAVADGPANAVVPAPADAVAATGGENGAPFFPPASAEPAPDQRQTQAAAQPAAQDNAEAVEEEAVEEGPVASTDRIPQSGDGVQAWAVAVRDAEVALTAGRKARIQAGTLVEETATVGEGESEASVCQVWSDGRWTGPARIAMTDLFRVSGTRGDVAAEDVDLLCRFYRVKGDLAAAKKAAATPDRALIDANPHAEEYRRLYREQQAFEKKVEELKELRDNSTGTKRMKASDDLRSMLHDQQALNRKIAEIDKKYKAWKKAHANDSAFVKPAADDSRLDALQDEFDELARRVAPFGAK